VSQTAAMVIQRTTGLVGVNADPTGPLGVATKQYVDNKTTTTPGPVIPAGSNMLFVQAAAPTGWTQNGSYSDRALRITGGAGAVAGGTLGFSSVFAYRNTDAFTLSIATMPPHSHSVLVQPDSGAIQDALLIQNMGANYLNSGGPYGNPYILSAGGGGSHVHSLDIRLAYVDVIHCVKN
jgi:hypothetical protein